MNNKEDIVKYYTKEADVYEYRRFENPKYTSNLRLKRKIEEVCRKYLVGDTLFEIACGTGYWEKAFSAMGFKYSGVDLTPTMVEKAKERGMASYRIGDVEDISVYPLVVDNIVCIKAFTMFQNQQVVLNNVAKSLKPGGRFIVFYNNRWNLIPLAYSLFKGGRRGLRLSSSYDEPISRRMFLGMLKKSGLKKILIKECCNIPFRFLPRWGWFDKLDDLLTFGWITYVVAEKRKLKWDNYQIEGLPTPIWGPRVPRRRELRCASCGSNNIYYSGTPADPEEILKDTVRCKDCGWITDWYEGYKAGHK